MIFPCLVAFALLGKDEAAAAATAAFLPIHERRVICAILEAFLSCRSRGAPFPPPVHRRLYVLPRLFARRFCRLHPGWAGQRQGRGRAAPSVEPGRAAACGGAAFRLRGGFSRVDTFLRPLRGLHNFLCLLPSAYALGYFLSPCGLLPPAKNGVDGRNEAYGEGWEMHPAKWGVFSRR